MDPKETESFLQLEWAAISAAPFSFIAALVGASILIWLLLLFSFKRQVIGLENENKANVATIRTLGERVTWAQEKLEAAEKALRDLKEEFSQYQEAVLQDAADRKQPVSPSVLAANTATENAMERLKERESAFSKIFKELLGTKLIVGDADYILRDDDFLKADNLKKFGDKDKGDD